ncbi:ArnT family glycosyltransferase, partial [Candidatus Leptofilum sp.]|uniref:ArnT family glycosyltransferase n=1 Tax=Candidatus Leptofilum sp. TaxID=3241576 RepID=UPI003B5CF27C
VWEWDYSGAVAGIFRTVGSIVVWGAMLLVAGGWGKKIAGKWLKDEPLLIQLSLEIILGMGALFLLMLVLGLAGLIRRWLVWGLFVALGGVAWRECRQWATALWTNRRQLIPPAETTQQKWLKIFIAINLGLAFLLALSPDISFDAHLYHLAMPKIYIEQGAVRHFFDMFVFGFPQMMEMLYTWGMALWSDQVPPLLHFAFGAMGLFLAGGIANRYFSRNAAWWSVALLCSVPTLTGLLSVTYTDLGLMCLATGMMYAFLRWREGWQAGEEQMFWLALAGILTGLLGNIKYTAVTMAFSMAGGIIVTSWRSGLKGMVKRLVVVGGIAGILVAPWLAKNVWQTGNPVYPFFLDEAKYWDAWRGDFYEDVQTGFYYTEPARLLYVPLELSLFGTEGTNFYDATIGPFVIGLAFLLPLVWGKIPKKKRQIVGYLLLFFSISYLFWLLGVARSKSLAQGRLLTFILPSIAIISAIVLDYLPQVRASLDVDWMSRIMINIGLLGILLTTTATFLGRNPLPAIIGLEPRLAYETRLMGAYRAALEEVNQLPANANVLFLWEPRIYPCQRQCNSDVNLDELLHHVQGQGQHAEEIANAWREEGFSHVLLHQSGLNFIQDEENSPIKAKEQAVIAEIKTNQLQQIDSIGMGSYVLYQLLD